MKKKKDYTLLALAIPFMIAVLFNAPGCYKSDSKPPVIIKHPTEYHFDVDNEGYDIYTEDMKLVGRIDYGKCGQLDSLIDKDNE